MIVELIVCLMIKSHDVHRNISTAILLVFIRWSTAVLPNIKGLSGAFHCCLQQLAIWTVFRSDTTFWSHIVRSKRLSIQQYKMEVTGSNPLKSWIFQASRYNCKNCIPNHEDHSSFDSLSVVQNMINFIYHFINQCVLYLAACARSIIT